MIIKRLFDVIASGIGIVFFAPFFLLIAVMIKIDSSGPVFFRQVRVGRFGAVFRIHKFRTMVINAEKKGPQITTAADPRVTRIGSFLRNYKVDELPQLIDVFVGHMSLVGPRPEVPKYVACYPEEVLQIVQRVRPGITDLASIKYRDENVVLEKSTDPHRDYVDVILPNKLKYYVDYVNNRTFLVDLKIIFKTLLNIIR